MTELLAAEAALTPIEFVAVTVNVNAVLAANPVTEIVPEPACESVAVTPPGLAVAVYVVIVASPLSDGAVNGTSTFIPFNAAVPIVGAPGTPIRPACT